MDGSKGDENGQNHILKGVHLPSEEQYLYCIRCGQCLSACPIYRESLCETDGPRARVALTRKVAEGELELSPKLVDNMYKCLACEACNAICPVGIRPAELALEMRRVIHQARPQPWLKRPIFHGYFPRRGLQSASMVPFRLYQRLGLQRAFRGLGVLKLLPAQLQDMERMLPPLPRRPLQQVLPELTPAAGPVQHRVAFFLGCFQSLIFAGSSAATVRVLARNGCQVYTPQDTKCCGMPAAGYGDVELVRELARHNIDLFERYPADVIITDCATCGSTLKRYGALLAGDPAYSERAQAFSTRVRDISEFLMSIDLRVPKGQVAARITYHDPCHLVRGQKIKSQPRALLRLVPGLEFVEMKEADWCCGAAGTQLITHYTNSLRVNRRKMDNVRATGAEFVTTGCPGCQMQLGMGAQHFQVGVRVLHPIQVLDEAYRREELGLPGDAPWPIYDVTGPEAVHVSGRLSR
ncbi:MAG: (Fe-S)-binding protein [Anaerolineae bacterium]